MLYIAIDCGKYNTKVKAYDPGKKAVTGRFKFRTKITNGGIFEDDMLDKDTFIVQVDGGDIYKVGRGAKTEPTPETDKKTDIHKICTMTATALAVGQSKDTDVSIVIGMPLSISNIPEERISYKQFILGNDDESHEVRIKTQGDGPVMTVHFTIKKRLVYPEGIGVLFEYPDRLDSTTAIIDNGNLNINNIYADRFTIIQESCFTDEFGGSMMIANLANRLSDELGMHCDTNLAASTLLRPYEKRCLIPVNGNQDIMEKSRIIINSYLEEHVEMIKRKCRTKQWPLDFMNVVCIGGTSRLLTREIHMVFGENAFIPPDPEYVNADGFLRKMCADSGIDIEGDA